MNRKLISAVALIIVILFIGAIIFQFVASAASTSSTLSSLKDKLASTEKKMKELEESMKDAEADLKYTMALKKKYDEQIELLENEISILNDIIAELDANLAQTNIKLEEAQQTLDSNYELFKERIVANYKNGDTAYLEVILGSSSFSELLTNIDNFRLIIKHDTELINRMKQAKLDIEEAKAQIESDLSEKSSAKQQLEQQEATLEKKVAAANNLMKKLEADKESYRAAYEKAEAEKAELEKQIAKIIAEMGSSKYVGGVFTWPAPGYDYITSEFGYRKHPILGTWAFHNGIDIGAPKNAKVVAANAGTVILASYNGGFGNCVIINHGGGIVTLYGHLNSIAVKKGDVVSKGQIIGYVGTTGLSTGYHLHFTVYENNVAVNPLNYYTKVS